MKKTELLQLLRQKYQAWEALIDQIGTERMDQPGVNGDWSMKDLIAHMTVWNQKLAGDFQAAQRGETAPPPPWPVHLQSEDEINAWIYAANRGRPAREILEDSRQAFQQIFSVMERLPDDARMEHADPAFHLIWVNGVRFLPGEFFHHFEDDHEQDVHAWLERFKTL